jgi:hypothetical protein
MSIYKYTSIENLHHILNGSIRLTQPGAFNDPFELAIEIYCPPEVLTTELNIGFDIKQKRRKKLKYKLNDDIKGEYCHDYISRVLIEQLNSSMGILCLTKNSDSLLMWAHYANGYSGVVIEFDDEHPFFEGLLEVRYTAKRPRVDIRNFFEDNGNIPISELFIKPSEWKYEREIRLARSLASCKKISDGQYPVYVADIPIECIKSITFGERTSIDEQRKIFDIIKNTHIGLGLAAISNRNYDFRYETIKYKYPISEVSPVISPRTANIFSEQQNQLGEISRFMIASHELSVVVNKTL